MKLARKLQNLIAECVKCAFIDKPFIRYQVYTHWLPSEVKILAIGESPPPGQKDSLFYNLKSFDRFRLSMKLILNVKDDLNVLKLLKSKNVFVTAAVKCRPLNKSKIEDMRRNCKYLLKTEIKLLKPKKIVAMGRTAALTISEVLSIDKPSSVNEISSIKINNLELYFAPHPNYVFRFKRDLASRIKDLLLK